MKSPNTFIFTIKKLKHISLIIAFCFSSQLHAQLPDGYNSEEIQNGYSEVMGVIFNNSGSQMFVWDKSGKLYVSNWDGSQYVKQTNPVLDISEEVLDWRDFGFASVCLDPNFDTNGLIYLFYMVDRHHLINFGTPQYDPDTTDEFVASISRVTRYQLNIGANPLTTDYNTRFVLLGESISTGIPLLHQSHAGGTILFGDDGTLLVSTGDNASYSTTDTGSVDHTYYEQAIADGIMRTEENVGAFRSQMITSLCGKILRLDPTTGDGVASNPHYEVTNPRSAKSRMWTMGLRNPFRMSFQPNSGSSNPADGNPGIIHVVDVGWNNWEDLHIIDKGGLNAGWPLYEGLSRLNSYYFSGATNADEGNELFRNNCSQPSSFVDDANPEDRRLVHNRPEVAWKHVGDIDTRVPWFSGTSAVAMQVGASGSPTTGDIFDGNTGVAGCFITGLALGSEYENKYFFTDYSRNWIKVATFNDGSENWISDISTFAENGFGQGIVSMNQNPLDGYVYYVNIYNGTIFRITFDDTLSTTSSVINQIKMFPNPATNYIEFKGITSNTSIEIYDVNGKKIHNEIISNNIKVKTNFASGLYFVKIINQETSLVEKLIIK